MHTNVYYKIEELRAIEDAVKDHPALVANMNHPSLVLFERKCVDKDRKSVLIFRSAADFMYLVREGFPYTYSGYAIDAFGDRRTGREIDEIFKDSWYSIENDSSPVGKISDAIKKYNDEQDAKEAKETELAQSSKDEGESLAK
jgi:hypothetical protein